MKKIFFKFTVLTVAGMLLLVGCSLGREEQPIQESRAEQASARQDISEQGTSEPGTFERGTFEMGTSEQETFEPETSVQESVERESSGQVTMKQDTSEKLETAGDGVPTIKITPERKEWYSDDGEELLYYEEAGRVEVIGEGFDALGAALAGQWKGLGDAVPGDLEWIKEYYEDPDHYYTGFSATEFPDICRLDNHVISLNDYFGDYLGGSHGTHGSIGRTYDVRSGKELQLEDILTDSQGFYHKAAEYIIARLGEGIYKNDLYQNYAETVRTDTFGEMPASWYLDSEGIVITYQLYQIAPYVAGTPSVTLQYDEFAAYIKEDYRIPCDSLVADIEENEDISGLIGETGEVMLVVQYNGYGYPVDVSVVSGNASEAVGSFKSTVWWPYVIKRTDGRSFLIFSCDYALEDFVTYVYEVTGGAVRFCDKLDSVRRGDNICIGTDRIGLFMHLDVLGTYEGAMVYQMTDDGKLVQAEEIFAIYDSPCLTVIKDLSVTIDGAAATISAGTKIRIAGTDNAGKAYFQVAADNGETGVIEYVRDDGQCQLLIGGVPEDEYFEKIPYER